ncbi:BT4734/BF3469 family protein [Flavobacterium sp. S87F.05.LMB.W.Kidney.N]|uniref:BT4734/BF3469 family protein n=1 Tax=Flavobacterium sp. S87F.05.LMB.W.Kidney.N TaxID=1278758 RepID=UPI0010648FA7|nr:BT4734/BF3469 family protein [Flavobacterium sp. S87F.05.LMB.W.Kidney.N]TDX11323.1 VirE-like protein [Flavobacterium sp. S87F.05.LMB.W.Kidney.N]
MIFNKYANCKKFSNEKITLDQLFISILDNPKKKEILHLRSLVYKSSYYNKLKLKLPVITPHGTFADSKKESIENLSGYLYFDIDGFASTDQLNDSIQKLNTEFPLTIICKSCGGKGIAFLLKVDGVTKDNFQIMHSFIRHQFKEKGYDIDDAAGGLIRKWVVSYDPDVIYNRDHEYKIDEAEFKKFTVVHKIAPATKIKRRDPAPICANSIDHPIPYLQLCTEIKTETEYQGLIAGDFSIDAMEYYRIIHPLHIKDGTKHKTYIRIINALYYLNDEISQHQVFSYIYHVNNFAENKMCPLKLKSLVTNIGNRIESTGQIFIKTRTKIIHFSKESKLSRNQKQSIGAKVNGALKLNKTKMLIETAISKLEASNIKVTKKKIAEELGISEKTVQRNWKKKVQEISELDFTFIDKPKNNNNILSEFDYDEQNISFDDEDDFNSGDFDFWN